MSDEGRLVAGRYRLGRRIGNGAMGIVWEAYDERLNRSVAVKQLLLQPGLSSEEAQEAKLRSMREGRIAARLHHPNAITVFDVVDEDGAPWLIMEYLRSKSLAAEMNERGWLPPDEVASIGAQIAAALAAAHAAGIVHRDIKPANILLGDNGSVKITDFGISRASDDVQVTKTGLIAGTPAYLAPEVAYGREPTAATDLFSLGSTLYAATEGEPPFGLSENTLGLLHAVAGGQINPPTKAGPLTGVLTALLSIEPDDRPTAAKARELLNSVANGFEPDLPAPSEAATMLVGAPGEGPTRLVGDADRTQMVGPPRPVAMGTRGGAQPVRRSRSRKPLAVGAVVLAVVIGGGAWYLSNSKNGESGNPHTPINDTNTSIQAPPPILPPPVSSSEEVEATTKKASEPPASSKPTSEPPPLPSLTTTTTTTTTTTKATTTTQPSQSG